MRKSIERRYLVKLEDGTFDVIRIDKPHGAAPDSVAAFEVAIRAAETTGKTVLQIEVLMLDATYSRSEALDNYR